MIEEMDLAKKKLTPLAYQISLKLSHFKGKKILVAFSGGRDSCALLSLLVEMKSRLNLELGIAHIHHGESEEEIKNSYRDRAQKFAREYAQEYSLQFLTQKFDSKMSAELETSSQNKQSEEALRKARAHLLEKMRIENHFDYVAYGHHAQDLFETRLIRLIRGTGTRGLESMPLERGKKLRPLLGHWPNEMQAYLEYKKISYLDDPSNRDVHYLRNWIRHIWIKELEKKRPGSNKAFARSLELLVSESHVKRRDSLYERSLNREEFRALNRLQQNEKIVSLLLKNQIQNYSQNMVQEICKRLDTNRKQLKFIVAGCEWQADAKQIFVRCLS